jgi:hypothetical protein
MDSAVPPMRCAQAEEATVHRRPFSAHVGRPHTAGGVGGLSMPSLVEGLATSCRERGPERGVVQCSGLIESDAAV